MDDGSRVEISSKQNETIQKGFNLEMQEEPTEKTEETEEIVLGAIPEWIQKLAPKELHDIWKMKKINRIWNLKLID